MAKFDPTINKHALDEEWLDQPKQYHYYALKLVEARVDEDEAKQRLELTKAELDLEVRQHPEHFNLTKVTEATVAGAILMHPEFKEHQETVSSAKHTTGIVAAAVHTLDQKRRALENLVELFGMDYFSEPKAISERSEKAVDVMRDLAVANKVRRRTNA